jgi:hypothetical protein
MHSWKSVYNLERALFVLFGAYSHDNSSQSPWLSPDVPIH